MAHLRVRARPRSRRDGVEGVHDGRLVVRVQAPPASGRANRAIEQVLADHLGIAAGGVAVVAGGSGRDKLVRVSHLTAGELGRRLE